MAWKVTTAPASEVLTTAEAKTHLRVDLSTEDSLIDGLVTAARIMAEKWCRRAFITQTITEYWDEFPGYRPAPFYDALEPSVSPLIGITTLSYTDTDGVSQTLNGTDYDLDSTSEPARITSATDTLWPSTLETPNAVCLVYTAGYGASSTDVPAPILAAIKLILADLFENRESKSKSMEIPPAAQALLSPYRIPRST